MEERKMWFVQYGAENGLKQTAICTSKSRMNEATLFFILEQNCIFRDRVCPSFWEISFF